MVGRADRALALLYGTAHPGAFSEVQQKIRTFVQNNFRVIGETSRSETLATDTVERANLLASSVLTEAENRIATLVRPPRRRRDQIII